MKFLTILAVCLAAASARRVINGEEAPVGAWPWQCSLEYTGRHTCGCVVADADYVFTAAHCVYGRESPANNFQAWAGVHDRETSEGTKYTINQIDQHPDYIHGLSYPNDFAILRPVSFIDLDEEHVAVAALDPHLIDTVHNFAKVTGWGKVCGGDGEECDPSQVLLQADIDVISNEQCSQHWSMIDSSHICVWDTDHQENYVCSGDSGSPLNTRDSETDDWYVSGVASWVASGCNPSRPAAYARIKKFCNDGFIPEFFGCRNPPL